MNVAHSLREVPLKRYMHAAIIFQNTLLIHGGMDEEGKPLNDTWIFDLVKKKWKHIGQKQIENNSNNISKNDDKVSIIMENNVPIPRWGCTGTIDDKGIVTVFGGHHLNGQCNDVHVLKVKLPANRKRPQYHTTHKKIDKMSVFSGSSSKRKNTWYKVNIDVQKAESFQVELQSPRSNSENQYEPRERYLHTMVQRKNFIHVFGGYPVVADTNIYTFDLLFKRWKIENIDHIEGSPIKGRWGHACSLSLDENYMIISFGRETRGCLNDLYTYHFGTNTWVEMSISDQSLEHTPTGRYGHSSVISSDGSLFIFGGVLPSGHKSNELFEYNFNMKKWRKVSLMIDAIPRAFHSAVITNQNQMILFGGEKENRLLVAGLDEIYVGHQYKSFENRSPRKPSKSPRTTRFRSKAEKRRQNALKKMKEFTSKRGIRNRNVSPSRLESQLPIKSFNSQIPEKLTQQSPTIRSPLSSQPTSPSIQQPVGYTSPFYHMPQQTQGMKRMGGGFQTHKVIDVKKKSSLIMNQRFPSPISTRTFVNSHPNQVLSPLLDRKQSYLRPEPNSMSHLSPSNKKFTRSPHRHQPRRQLLSLSTIKHTPLMR